MSVTTDINLSNSEVAEKVIQISPTIASLVNIVVSWHKPMNYCWNTVKMNADVMKNECTSYFNNKCNKAISHGIGSWYVNYICE